MKRCISICIIASLFAYSCQTKPKENMQNPFFQTWDTPFEVPPFDKIIPAHYIPAFEEGMRQQNEEIVAIINNSESPNFKNTIAALDYSGSLLDKVAAVFFNVLETNNNEEMQQIAQEISPKLSAHSDAINFNIDLFKRVKFVYDNSDNEKLTQEEQRLLEKTYKDFIRGGVNLSGEQKERFAAINQRIAKLTLDFNNNVLAATNAYKLIIEDSNDLKGLPANIVEAAKEEANKDNSTKGKWVFTLQNPSLIPFLEYAQNRDKRQEIWQAYSQRCIGGKYDNNTIINELVNLRIERAQLLGYQSHAAFILDENMAKTSEAVYELLLKVWEPALKKAKEELAYYQKKAGDEKIAPWDWRYYTEIIRNEQFNINQDSLRPYFSLPNVLQGVFSVAKNLYGLTFEKNKTLPIYDSSVVTYEVKDQGNTIGILYMDFYARESKSSGAWMTEFRGQYRTPEGKNILPIISVVCNFSNPTINTPSLLNIDEVQTLFHEFGHALHGLLSKCQYKSMAGTNVSRDFVELPSQIMENWATCPEVLKSYAKHYQTGETIPQYLIDKISQSETFGQGFINTELIAASLLDMDYHTLTIVQDINPIDFETKAMQKYGLIPEIISRYKSQYFKHIFTDAFGYSAGYYGYTWAAVLDADAFEAFKENGLFDTTTAKAFRSNILEKGNSVDPMEAYKAFRKKEPSIEPLLNKRGLK